LYNPQLDHFYDGEGFGIEFHVEALDGSVVPAGFADQEEEDAGDNTDKKEDATGDDDSLSKDKREDTEKVNDNIVDEQQKYNSYSE
jgi:hypothetical protein